MSVSNWQTIEQDVMRADIARPSRRTLLKTVGCLCGAAAVGAIGCGGPAAHAQVAGGPVRELTQIAQGIWRSRQDRHYGLVIEGDQGLLVFDTIDHDFALWLRGRLAAQFTKKISHVVYSHNHADHVSGGEVFEGDGVRFISHDLARASQVRSRVATRYADETFVDRLSVDLGNRRIDLAYHGRNDGRGSISLMVPDQQLLSAVDWVLADRLPFMDLSRYDLDGMIDSVTAILALDWHIVSPGHASIGDKAAVTNYLNYLTALRDQTMPHVVAGTPVAQAVADVSTKLAAVPSFKSLQQFDDWVGMNVRGAYAQLDAAEGFSDAFPPQPGTL